ncbi:lipid II flippase Amj family protein [Tellurirhabdus bombi]|uniref:lipid II flippase Amj family protein n=1 Tax=Tellurirhabdus bombi TaxID=2907205 RepID=UPI001F45FC50|nr:lipid II flippase Amj family protein [Tellurirhabdus bombi]
MSAQILLVSTLTFVIHLISTLSIGTRVVGIRTSRWAVSFSLFNTLALVTRLANTIQAPLLAKTVEMKIKVGHFEDTAADFRWIIAFTTLATLAGMLLFPSFQRLLARAVEGYYTYRSIPKLILRSMSPAILRKIPAHMKWPDRANWQHITRKRNISLQLFVLNALANAVLTVSVLSTLYAGYINPELRSTSASLSGMINGGAAIILVTFVDPSNALLSDEVVAGRYSEGYFRRYVIWMLLSRLSGTIIAQLLLVPFAYLIVWVAENLRV